MSCCFNNHVHADKHFALFEVKKTSNHKWIFRFLFCIINVILTPFILVYQSIYIYVLPCISVTICHYACKPLRRCLRNIGCCSKVFVDKSFPHNAASLGSDTHCEWIRIVDLKSVDQKESTTKKVLFSKVSSDSVNQGELGDCWILAAFAVLCHRPENILKCFITRELSEVGKYTVRLFDIKTSRFVHITVDDFVPCRHGVPIFCRYQDGCELWPLILEKAYAKYKGSYQSICGGIPIDALRTLTGYQGDSLIGPFDKKVFETLRKYLRKGCLLAAGSHGEDKSRVIGRSNVAKGIVGGHAYSILDILKPHLTTDEVLLLKLRNPWGSFEWDGDWGDKSHMWASHPGVSWAISPKDKDDGIFYMSWADFCTHFHFVDVLYPERSFDSLHFKVKEDVPCCGATVGCLAGCGRFWCMCRGMSVLWQAKSSEQLRDELTNAEVVYAV